MGMKALILLTAFLCGREARMSFVLKSRATKTNSSRHGNEIRTRRRRMRAFKVTYAIWTKSSLAEKNFSRHSS